jgi:type IV pilus assembly protein PilN
VIKVNLLAANPGTQAPRIWIPREQRSAFMGLGLLLLAALGSGGWWYYLRTDHARVEASMRRQERELVRLKEAATLVQKVSARKTELTERLNLIERLRSAKREPVSLLETISRSLPEGLWLLEMKQTGVIVNIEGRAMSLSSLTDFAERIQNSGLFKHPVEIVTTATEAVEDTDVVRFAIKAEAITAIPPEPVEPPTRRGARRPAAARTGA